MKLKKVVVTVLVSMMIVAGRSSAETITQIAIMDAGAISFFSIEFYKDDKVLHGSEGITFTNLDTTQSWCLPDGRASGDGKSDTGVICRTNMNLLWYLKLSASTASSGFNLANFKYYIGQPWNRKLGTSADGSLAKSPGWYSIPGAPTTVYTAGTQDKNNYEPGTLATFSYAIYPEGMTGGSTYVINITYTLTTDA